MNEWTQAQDCVDVENKQFIYTITECYIQSAWGIGLQGIQGRRGKATHFFGHTHHSPKQSRLQLQGWKRGWVQEDLCTGEDNSKPGKHEKRRYTGKSRGYIGECRTTIQWWEMLSCRLNSGWSSGQWAAGAWLLARAWARGGNPSRGERERKARERKQQQQQHRDRWGDTGNHDNRGISESFRKVLQPPSEK